MAKIKYTFNRSISGGYFNVSIDGIGLKINFINDKIKIENFHVMGYELSKIESCLARLRGYFNNKENRSKAMELRDRSYKERPSKEDDGCLYLTSTPTGTNMFNAYLRNTFRVNDE